MKPRPDMIPGNEMWTRTGIKFISTECFPKVQAGVLGPARRKAAKPLLFHLKMREAGLTRIKLPDRMLFSGW